MIVVSSAGDGGGVHADADADRPARWRHPPGARQRPGAWALIAALVGLVIGAAAWALGVHSQNYQQSMVGRRAVLVSGLAALLIGAAPTSSTSSSARAPTSTERGDPSIMFDLSVLAASPLAAAAAVGRQGAPASRRSNPLCYAAGAVGSLGGSVASAGVDAVLGGLSQWVAGGAEWLLSQIGNVLISTTTIDVGADWFRTHYAVMTALAAVVVLPMLLVSTLQAVFRQSAGQLVRTFFVQLPLALLLGVVAIQIVILCLSATDAMCTEVAGGSGSDVKALLAGMTKGLLRRRRATPRWPRSSSCWSASWLPPPPSCCGSSSWCAPPPSTWRCCSSPSRWPPWSGRRCRTGAGVWSRPWRP